MNKYMTLAVIIMILLFATYMVDVTDVYTTTSTVGTVLSAPENTDVVTIFSMASTFFSILTFQIDGLPAIINILFFYPLSGAVLYMIIDVVKDLIPFT